MSVPPATEFATIGGQWRHGTPVLLQDDFAGREKGFSCLSAVSAYQVCWLIPNSRATFALLMPAVIRSRSFMTAAAISLRKMGVGA
jgi:hypothetical protein